MTINELKNSTIAMLNRDEIGFFELLNKGVYTYKGTLKSRKYGFITNKVSEVETHFTSEQGMRFEFIRIQYRDEDLSDGKVLDEEYAVRLYDQKKHEYLTNYNILWGCDFFR